MSGFEQPEEALLQAAGELGAAVAAEVGVEWLASSGRVPAPPAAGTLSLAITDRGLPVANLHLQRRSPFSREEQQLLGLVAQGVSRSLTLLSQQTESRLLAALSSAITTGASPEEAMLDALHRIISLLGADAAVLLQMLAANTDSRVLAAAGAWPGSSVLTPGHHDIARSAATAGVPQLHSGNIVSCPLVTRAPARFVLLLSFPEACRTTRMRLPALRQVALVMAPHLDMHWRVLVLTSLLELHHASEETPTDEMYRRMLDSAIQLIPGAESGTLLVRRNQHEPFIFKAARGFEPDELVGTTLEQFEAQAWYGTDLTGWQQGKPRLVRRDQVDIEKFGRASTPRIRPSATRYERIEATLCLPVLRDGNVMAILNVENQHDPLALGRDSTEIIHLFGPPLSGLLHRQHSRDVLRHTALIDELTGLANRRAFDDTLKRELARRTPEATSLGVLLMDMKNFKLVNDSFGHTAGDEALATVAQALKTQVRASDLLSRWGGDEFAVILMDASAVDAAVAAERFRQVVAAVRIHGVPLRIDVGFASSPADGQRAEELLAAADTRMYADKRKPRGAG
jgi:diguanylate cyclase (GGDEF)-like protein